MSPGVCLACLANPHRARLVEGRLEVGQLCDDFLYRVKDGACGPVARRAPLWTLGACGPGSRAASAWRTQNSNGISDGPSGRRGSRYSALHRVSDLLDA
jgi:hypothetical protein